MYSEDLVSAAIRLCRKFSCRKVAILLEIGKSTICRWKKRLSIGKRKQRVSKAVPVIDAIQLLVENQPTITVNDIRNKINEATGLLLSCSLIQNVLKAKLGFRRKRIYRFHESSKSEEKLAEFLVCREELVQQGVEFISVDEVGFGRGSLPKVGWCKRGKRLKVISKPISKNISVCAAIARSGLIAFTESSKAFNRESFLKFLETLPSGRKCILLDNASFHHCQEIKALANEKQWILLYVPPYSPIFNPIECFFSVVKNNWRRQMSIRESFMNVSNSHFGNFFDHSFAAIEQN
jgi:transposase